MVTTLSSNRGVAVFGIDGGKVSCFEDFPYDPWVGLCFSSLAFFPEYACKCNSTELCISPRNREVQSLAISVGPRAPELPAQRQLLEVRRSTLREYRGWGSVLASDELQLRARPSQTGGGGSDTDLLFSFLILFAPREAHS